jgi:hypothetical protein
LMVSVYRLRVATLDRSLDAGFSDADAGGTHAWRGSTAK